VGAASITSPIGLAWSITKPNGERRPPMFQRLRTAQAVLLGDREDKLEADWRRLRAVARRQLQ